MDAHLPLTRDLSETATADFKTILAPLHLLQHPFYQDWMAGRLTQQTLQDYASQYFAHVKAFPRYLGAIHSFCENEQDRKILLENLNDEEGTNHEASHPELWIRFAEGLGANRAEVQSAKGRAAIQMVIDTFFFFARSSFHEGLGALYAYESQIPEIAHSKIEGLKSMYGLTDPRALQFFEVHKTADVYHRQAVEQILAKLPDLEKQQALKAAQTAGQALWNFLSEVHAPKH